jgi:pimeloyl-ACP methyl ester carboxylesterase
MPSDPTIVLVHGAFADASSWNPVIAELQRDGRAVHALANPLRGLNGDAAYVASAVQHVDGPVVLVGHSYGGMVITQAAAGTPNVAGLVYVAAFIPEVGESIGDINAAYPQTGSPPDLQPATYPIAGQVEPGVELTISQETFPVSFAADLPIETTRVAAAAQRPPSVACFGEPATETAWRSIPSWALVATADQMIHPDAERAMAARAGATTVEVDASHAVALSQPRAVADVIRSAIAASTAGV